jgi:hypothetical protein
MEKYFYRLYRKGVIIRETSIDKNGNIIRDVKIEQKQNKIEVRNGNN